MPSTLLCLLLVLSFFPAVFCTISTQADFKIKLRWKLFWWILFITLITWAIGCSSRPWKIDREEIVDYTEIKLFNSSSIQVVNYINSYGMPQTINLNKKFNMKLDENAKIKIKYYSNGPYCGIFLESKFENFEIVYSVPNKK